VAIGHSQLGLINAVIFERENRWIVAMLVAASAMETNTRNGIKLGRK
jgi:hypothetical protein